MPQHQSSDNLVLEQHFPNLKNTLCQSLHQQWLTGNFCDLMVSTTGESILCHSCVWSAFSTKMAKMVNRLPSGHLNVKLHVNCEVGKIVVSALYTGVIRVAKNLIAQLNSLLHYLDLSNTFPLTAACFSQKSNSVESGEVVALPRDETAVVEDFESQFEKGRDNVEAMQPLTYCYSKFKKDKKYRVQLNRLDTPNSHASAKLCKWSTLLDIIAFTSSSKAQSAKQLKEIQNRPFGSSENLKVIDDHIKKEEIGEDFEPQDIICNLHPSETISTVNSWSRDRTRIGRTDSNWVGQAVPFDFVAGTCKIPFRHCLSKVQLPQGKTKRDAEAVGKTNRNTKFPNYDMPMAQGTVSKVWTAETQLGKDRRSMSYKMLDSRPNNSDINNTNTVAGSTSLPTTSQSSAGHAQPLNKLTVAKKPSSALCKTKEMTQSSSPKSQVRAKFPPTKTTPATCSQHATGAILTDSNLTGKEPSSVGVSSTLVNQTPGLVSLDSTGSRKNDSLESGLILSVELSDSVNDSNISLPSEISSPNLYEENDVTTESELCSSTNNAQPDLDLGDYNFVQLSSKLERFLQNAGVVECRKNFGSNERVDGKKSSGMTDVKIKEENDGYDNQTDSNASCRIVNPEKDGVGKQGQRNIESRSTLIHTSDLIVGNVESQSASRSWMASSPSESNEFWKRDKSKSPDILKKSFDREKDVSSPKHPHVNGKSPSTVTSKCKDCYIRLERLSNAELGGNILAQTNNTWSVSSNLNVKEAITICEQKGLVCDSKGNQESKETKGPASAQHNRNEGEPRQQTNTSGYHRVDAEDKDEPSNPQSKSQTKRKLVSSSQLTGHELSGHQGNTEDGKDKKEPKRLRTCEKSKGWLASPDSSPPSPSCVNEHSDDTWEESLQCGVEFDETEDSGNYDLLKVTTTTTSLEDDVKSSKCHDLSENGKAKDMQELASDGDMESLKELSAKYFEILCFYGFLGDSVDPSIVVLDSGQRMFKCSGCPRLYQKRTARTKHLHNVHPDLCPITLKCSCCGHQARNPTELRNHAHQLHQNERPFRCSHPGCKYFAAKLEAVLQHLVTHMDVWSFSCEKCNTHFKSETCLCDHQKRCFRSQECICDICGQKFNHKTSLKVHIRSIHENIKRHLCPICGKTFPHNANFKRHLRIHNNTFPYSCKFCTDKFRHSNTLKSHMECKHGLKWHKQKQPNKKQRVVDS